MLYTTINLQLNIKWIGYFFLYNMMKKYANNPFINKNTINIIEIHLI